MSKFDKAIMTNPSALILIHSPNCGHCVAMMGEWKKLCSHLTKNMAGNMAIININAAALSNIKHKDLTSINGFPTILAVHADKPAVQFQGNRVMPDMLQFSRDNFQLLNKKMSRKLSKKKPKKKKKSRKGKSRKLL